MGKLTCAYIAEDEQAESSLRAAGVPSIEVFRFVYKGHDGRVGFDVDELSNEIALMMLRESVIWDFSESHPVRYSNEAAYAESAYLFLKGPMYERHWRPRVSFSRPSENFFGTFMAKLERGLGGAAGGSGEAPDASESLLVEIARFAEFFQFACVWNMMQLQPLVVSRCEVGVVSALRSFCDRVGVPVRVVSLLEVPEW